ncbi:MAG: YbjN domain-containing protein [Arcanobacterium sp.]|nr:YbjN domain-containing protein [Arcanobacterium sp.]
MAFWRRKDENVNSVDSGNTGFESAKNFEQPVVPEYPTPITMQRIQQVFVNNDWVYDLIDENTIQTGFDGYLFRVKLDVESEYVHIAGYNKEVLSDKLFDIVSGHIQEWHRTKLFPKAYLMNADEEEGMQLVTEHSGSYRTTGATDEQLKVLFNCAIPTALSFFRELQQQITLEQEFNEGDLEE